MKKMPREDFEKLFIKCDVCGYRNKIYFIKKTGTCNCCGKILDKKAKMKFEIIKRRKKNVNIKNVKKNL